MPVEYQQLKERLLVRKERLEAETTGMATVAGTNVGYGSHIADDAGYAYEQAKTYSLQKNIKGLLVQVEDALQRFGLGTYGVCVNCGQSIDPARLKAIPYAPLCISCAQAQNH